MSLTNELMNQHVPTIKHVNGIFVKPIELTTNDSTAKTIKYPKGVLQLKGNLQKITKAHFALQCYNYQILLIYMYYIQNGKR